MQIALGNQQLRDRSHAGAVAQQGITHGFRTGGSGNFGTGFSSLASLQRLPLQRLKIDRCFVQDLPSNRSDRSIVKATILMAHELGLSCLAEGVETDSQREHLLELGCDSFQGYLLGRPMPAEQLKELIAAS
ncbi:MAG: EAL domain-containing protein [Cyanobacteria bacterium K_DeepCast_150m_m2_101]|nr:EAL domain-containing protein [Cyanobacteria bacterium K_DeepCast_0m_m1_088]MBM5818850.1 EAL domain-containing protein [Cyanobacteria bacterium K_DeepCast_150m_m2_101]